MPNCACPHRTPRFVRTERVSVVLLFLIAFLAAAGCQGRSTRPAASANDGRVSTPTSEREPLTFDALFTGATMRFDYMHHGNADREAISVDGYRIEGAWPGSRTQLIDPTGFGKYRFRVHDRESGRAIWSRGFASIYGEWETTGEARTTHGAFHESQRFPEPRRPVVLVLDKRGDDGRFAEIFRVECDPQSRFVDRGEVQSTYRAWSIVSSGNPATKVDLLFLGDGYTADEMDKWHADATRLAEALLAEEPFRSRRDDFNVWAIDVPSEASGVTNPRAGFWNRTRLGLQYNSMDSDRYMLSMRNREIRDIAAAAPYDAMILVANSRKYGGGGIFNLYSTAAADSAVADYLIVHEFGHAFAGLGDEYYTSPVSYEEFTTEGVEPWEPNITALVDPATLEWRDLVDDATPIPTPWNQTEYDRVAREYQAERQRLREAGASEETLEELFEQIKQKTRPMLDGERFAGKVGAFEGAGYQAKGLYRPEADCVMFTRNRLSYCRVCRRAVERIIDLYVR